jgi:hypothetical protein
MSSIHRNIRRAGLAGVIAAGCLIVSYHAFSDEAFWGDTLKLHQAIAGVSPATALAVVNHYDG